MSRITEKEQLFDEMAAFNRKLRSFFDARVAEKGLTLARARTLFALSRRGPLTQKELAEELEIETRRSCGCWMPWRNKKLSKGVLTKLIGGRSEFT